MGLEVDVNLIREAIRKGKRLDRRQAEQVRKVEFETGVVSSAEGSARVKLGDTEVLAGVKIALGTPYADTPDEGVLMVAAELVPLASPEFEAGRPGEEAIELARVVDRAIRESHAVHFDQLCVEAEKAVWMVYVDIDVLNDDGNLIDASCMAAVAALKTAKMPALEKKEGGGYEVDYEKHEGPLPMDGTPIETTLVKISDSIIMDPSAAEYKALDARLTIGTIDINGETNLCSMQKGGPGALTVDEVSKMIDMAVTKGEDFRKKIQSLK